MMNSNVKRKRNDNDVGEKRQKVESSEISSILEQLDFDALSSGIPGIGSSTSGNASDNAMGYNAPGYGTGYGSNYGSNIGHNGGHGQASEQNPEDKTDSRNIQRKSSDNTVNTKNSDSRIAKKPQHSYNYSDFEQSLQDSTLPTASISSKITTLPSISQPSPNMQNQGMNMMNQGYGMQFPMNPYMNPMMNPMINPNLMPYNTSSEDNKNQRREECTAFVTNLSPSVTRNDLKKHFEQCGPVESAVVALDQLTKKSKGHAFINFHHSESVDNAIRMFDNTKFGGTTISVSRKKSSKRAQKNEDDSSNPQNTMNQPPQAMVPNPMMAPNPMGIPQMQYGVNGPGFQPTPYGQSNYGYGSQYMMQPQNNFGMPPPQPYGYGQNNEPPNTQGASQVARDQSTYDNQEYNNESSITIPSSSRDSNVIKESDENSDEIKLGDAEFWKDDEFMFKVTMVCGRENQSEFFSKRFTDETSRFDLQRFTSKKTFDHWYVTNKKHVRVLEIIPGSSRDDYSKLISTLEKEYSLYVGSDSLKGCIVLANALHGYPAKHEVIGLFVRSSGRKK